MAPRLLGPVGWGSAAVLGLLTGVVFVLVLIPAKDAVLPTRIKYGLVFDAGSTHTSLYIYRWPADKENDTGIVSQVEACSVAGPGISSYADDPAGAGAGLKPCLDRAMKIVPAEQQRETPTYLGATAGMRLLREENSTKAEQVLAEVSKAIGAYPVDFRGARILTGSEEGSFGWITVNYLLETLVKFSFAEKWAHPQDTEVLGALDLGGASTQITFQPGVPVEDRNTSVFFRLYGTDYSLYSHSYLCYGQSQALKMLLAALHQVPRGTGAAQPSPSAMAHLPLQCWACPWAQSWELAEPCISSREAKNCLFWVEGGGGCQPGLPSPHTLTCSGIFCNFPRPAVCVVFLLSPFSRPCCIPAQREVSQHRPCTTAWGQRQNPVLWEPGILRELTGGVHPALLGCRSCFLGWAAGRVSVAWQPHERLRLSPGQLACPDLPPLLPQGVQGDHHRGRALQQPLCACAKLSQAWPRPHGDGDRGHRHVSRGRPETLRLQLRGAGAVRVQWGLSAPCAGTLLRKQPPTPPLGRANGILGHSPWKTALEVSE
uniref:Ectonucleoside triphosphate diphosphohydrolase 8 n=1 Tax=Taeniopygia guttata TaxID=59729 RepID=A0A674HUC4_TAEGU